MKIALIGYGKMGKTIEALAVSAGHTVVLKIQKENVGDFTQTNLQTADVAIEFSQPDIALENVLRCLEAGVPVVSGTTGWNEDLSIASEYATQHKVGFIHASNFSIGVNIFFELAAHFSRVMQQQQGYVATITETHHTAKKDIPSGTAITLAEKILPNTSYHAGWSISTDPQENTLPIIAHRVEDVPGTHCLSYDSIVDSISLTHTAHSREGFALGAIQAASFIVNKKGPFSMKDVLGM